MGQHRLYLCLPAVVLSVGWGLRGSIGGGPLGAMIPGALVALVVALLLERNENTAAWLAACGAVGIGLGGQMTYGQTVGLTLGTEKVVWGLLGLTAKGAIWGLSGGVMLGLGLLSGRRIERVRTYGLGLALVATIAGWRGINVPKLVYFSNSLEMPREEVWAGLAAGALVLLAVLVHERVAFVPLRFAVWGTLGGGVGFGLGGWLNMLGRATGVPLDWWKVMELTFGALFGLALGQAAWTVRHAAGDSDTVLPHHGGGFIQTLIMAAAAALCAIGSQHLKWRIAYSLAAVVLLLGAALWATAARQVAFTVTAAAFFLDLLKARPELERVLGWTLLVVASATMAWAVERWRQPGALFALLLWVALADGLVKAFVPWPAEPTQTIQVQTVLVALGVVAQWLVWRLGRGTETAPPS